MANGNFSGGDGTSSSPYLVEDVYDLLNATQIGCYYKQINDIDLLDHPSGENFKPIEPQYNGTWNSSWKYLSPSVLNLWSKILKEI